MQCKDIPNDPILEFLAKETHEFKWATYGRDSGIMPTVSVAMPKDTPTKLQAAKMGQLIKRGLVEGCACGCRGDFWITEKGKAHLSILPQGE